MYKKCKIYNKYIYKYNFGYVEDLSENAIKYT